MANRDADLLATKNSEFLSIPRLPRPSADRSCIIVKAPNRLQFADPASLKFPAPPPHTDTPTPDLCGVTTKEDLIQWTFARDAETNEVFLGPENEPKLTTNTHLIQWSDGTWTLAVGDTQYECQLQGDRSHLLETSDPRALIYHTPVTQKMTLRPFGIPSSLSIRNAPLTPRTRGIGRQPVRSGIRPKATQLTAIATALAAESECKRRLRAMKELGSHPGQQSVRGTEPLEEPQSLNASFLEADDDEDK